ncbi:MAG: TlpA disulfide reductase family protein [Gammaproteobacteria bacterium]|jgi:thiol-disulfide isomerase/thioredoxin
MLTKRFPVAAFVLMLPWLLSSCDKPQPPLNIKVGQALPEINVQDLQGKPATLSLATGKVVILNVWATWCGPCRHELPSLERLAQTLDKDRFSVVGLSVDADDYVVREFLIERKVGFNNYRDPGMSVANDVFGVRAFPSTLVFSPSGQLLEVIEGWREWDTPSMVGKLSSLAAQRG